MKKTFLKKLVTAGITAVTALSVFRGVPTFAETVVNTPTANQDITVSIRKTLNIAEGITIPNATFSFQFTPKEVAASGVSGIQTAPVNEVTPIMTKTVKYSAADQLQSGQDNIKKESENIFNGIVYPHAGEYVYTVAEQKDGWTAIKKDDKKIDAMKYDDRTYEMHVFVKNKSNSNETYISSVYFKEINQGIPGEKKDSQVGKNGNFTFDLFENTYTKDAGKITPDEPNPNQPGDHKLNPDAKSLIIKKLVKGDLASKSQDFTFSLTITLPKTATEKSVVGKIGQQSYTFQSGVAQQFKLRHDQTLEFDTIPAGAKYTLIETGTTGYTASNEYLVNGVKNTGLGSQSTDFSVTNILIGEKTNSNNITNTYQDVTPTGLLIDNLPFILMIGLGLAGFVILSKKRRQA